MAEVDPANLARSDFALVVGLRPAPADSAPAPPPCVCQPALRLTLTGLNCAMGPKRAHSPSNDSRTNAKFRGSLSWNTQAAQPKFLRNALAALQGQPANSSAQDKGLGPDGRPLAPGRPGGAQEESSEEDEWDFGRGEEAPAVVVLKEKHIGRDEVDRLRAEG